MPVLFVGHGSPLYAIQDNQWSRAFRGLRDLVARPSAIVIARRVCDLIGEGRAELNAEWGLDHGTWSVLRWMYPQADVPVIQLSVDRNLTVPEHFELAQTLAPLREENVLIMGSGNATHNLRDLMLRMQTGDTVVPDWARRFDERLKELLLTRDTKELVELWPTSDDARRSHPTPDHFLPIVYAYAATDSQDETRFPIEGFDHSASMRAILFESN